MKFEFVHNVFHRKYLLFLPYLLLALLMLSAWSSSHRIFSLIPFILIMLNALYIVVKIIIYTMRRSFYFRHAFALLS